MKNELITVSVGLGSLAPLLALFLAITIDRRCRKRSEKPPQAEELLRPPGYSLAIRLEETQITSQKRRARM
jgi:hypothetical protein